MARREHENRPQLNRPPARRLDPAQLAGAPHAVPRRGLLELDFLKMVVRARTDACISSRTLRALQAVAASDRQSEAERLGRVETLAEELWLSVGQLDGLLAALDGGAPGSRLRCSVVVSLFSRLVDRAHFAQVEARLSREEQSTVRRPPHATSGRAGPGRAGSGRVGWVHEIGEESAVHRRCDGDRQGWIGLTQRL